MKITGTTFNYFIHCKRQCWLKYNQIGLEFENTDVQIGKALHEIKFNNEIQIENIKLDKITNEYVYEFKKSDSDIEAATYQLLYYLYVLKQKGIERKGKIFFKEKNNQDENNIIIELNDITENKLLTFIKEIEKLLILNDPPEIELQNKCRRCAYYEYCFI